MVVVVTVMDLFIANVITKLAGVSESYHMYLAFINMVVNCVIHVMIARVNFSDVNNIKLAYVLYILASVLSLWHVTWTGALMSNETSFSRWIKYCIVRLG